MLSSILCFVGVSFTIYASVSASDQPHPPTPHDQMPLGQDGYPLGHLNGCALSISQSLASNQTTYPILDEFCEGSIALLSETERASFACEIGRLLFREEDEGWIGMNSSNYLERASINWSGTSQLNPKCIFSPTGSHEVALSIKIITLTRSRFSIRSGGHNPNRGWSNTDSRGLLIDLYRINKIELSEDKQVAKIGPGNRWLSVYEFLDGSGVTVLGGRTPDVGVGGVIIGGGIPSFSSEYGLVCDMVENFEVVLANSQIVNANPTENSDLFWALKGGGANFGIVTEFTLRTISIDKVWFEAVLYDPSQNKRVLKAIAKYQEAAEMDGAASFAFSLSNEHTFVAWLYSNPIERPKVYDMFYDIPIQTHFADSKIGSPVDFTASLATVLGPPVVMRRAIVAVSSKPSLELYEKAYEKWLAVSNKFFSVTGAGMTFGIQPVTKNATLQGKRNGGSPLNLSLEPQTWFTTVAQWTNLKDDEAAYAAVQEVGDFYRDTARSMGILLDFVFMNDANFYQNPIASYGADNVRKLKKTAKKYDPDEVFQVLQAGGFLLRNA